MDHLFQAEDLGSIVGDGGEQLFEESSNGIKIPKRQGQVVFYTRRYGCADSRLGQDLFGFRVKMVQNKQYFRVGVRPLMKKLTFHVERICHNDYRSQPEHGVIGYHTLGSVREHHGHFRTLSHSHLLKTVRQPKHMVP